MRTLTKIMLGLPAFLLSGCAIAPEGASESAETTSEALTFPQHFCLSAETPCEDGASCQGHLSIGGKTLPYARNHAFTSNAYVTRAMIVLHGASRTNVSYFNYAVNAAKNAESANVDSCARTDTIIFAPKFEIVGDSPAPLPNDWVWNDGGWSEGDPSVNSDASISSYDVLDTLVKGLADASRFPRLKTIDIIGFSGGGQMTQRYAAGNRTDGTLRAGVSVRYVVGDPSSYLYFTPDRPTADGSTFVDPYLGCPDHNCNPNPALQQPPCPQYDNYRYGLVGLNPYMIATGTWTMMAQYEKRNVTYLIGDLDNDPVGSDTDLDVNCGAEYEGKDRYQRAVNYVHYMNAFFPSNGHQFFVVPGAAHQPSKVIPSTAAVNAMFR